MIIVRLMGGLGNQMFQYAFGRALAVYHQAELKLDLSFLLARHKNATHTFRNYDLDIFPGVTEAIAKPEEISRYEMASHSIAARFFSKIRYCCVQYYSRPVVEQRGFVFDANVFKANDDCLLIGTWQSEKFFESIAGEIRKIFAPDADCSEAVSEMAARICGSRAICLNVRRGDFVSHARTNAFHGVCGIDYYSRAAAFIARRIADPVFYVFSDDPDWCCQNIRLQFPVVFVGHEYAGDRFRDYFYLMRNCEHFIIPNSTFGWWAAWLGNCAGKIVVAPERWFNKGSLPTHDLLPRQWVLL